MAYDISGGTVQPAANAIASYNLTHKAVAAAEIALATKPHYDGSDFDVAGVEQVLSSFYSAPTTFAGSVDVVEKACDLWDNRHTAKYNSGTAGIFAHKVAGTVIGGTPGPSGAALQQAMVDAWGPICLEVCQKLQKHMLNTGGVFHTNPDLFNALGTLPASITTAGQISYFGNLARAVYEDHRVYTTGSVHDSADSTNVMVAAPIDNDDDYDGMKALLLDLKTQINAHELNATVHVGSGSPDNVNAITGTAAYPAAVSTAFTRANTYKSTHNTDLGSSTIHQSADGTNTISSSNATTVATYKTLAAEIYTDQTAHFRFAPNSPAQRGV